MTDELRIFCDNDRGLLQYGDDLHTVMNEATISVRESSLATARCCWLRIDRRQGGMSVQLDEQEALQLIKRLALFINYQVDEDPTKFKVKIIKKDNGDVSTIRGNDGKRSENHDQFEPDHQDRGDRGDRDVSSLRGQDDRSLDDTGEDTSASRRADSGVDDHDQAMRIFYLEARFKGRFAVYASNFEQAAAAVRALNESPAFKLSAGNLMLQSVTYDHARDDDLSLISETMTEQQKQDASEVFRVALGTMNAWTNRNITRPWRQEDLYSNHDTAWPAIRCAIELSADLLGARDRRVGEIAQAVEIYLGNQERAADREDMSEAQKEGIITLRAKVIEMAQESK